MPVIDPKGMFEGERIGRCSKMARLYWPYYLCASNGFGRIEISYAKITATAFSTFGDPPTENEVKDHIREYADNCLLFLYRSNGHLWGQWDSKSWTFGTHKSAADKRSPAPPVEAFEAWIARNREHSRQQQESEIATLDASGSEALREVSGEPAEGRESSVNSAEDLRKPNENVAEEFRKTSAPLTEDFRGGIGVGVGIRNIGVGVGSPNPEAAPIRFSFPELAIQVLTALGIASNGRPRLVAVVASSIETKAHEPGWTREKATLHFVERGMAYKAWALTQKVTKSWENWFGDGDYDKSPDLWKSATKDEPALVNGKKPASGYKPLPPDYGREK